MQDYERNILDKYNVDIRSTRKTRGAVLCDAEQGLFLLKEVSVSSERMQALIELYNYIEKQEWYKVDGIVPNRDGEYITSQENGSKYILKKWFHARECDIRKPSELLEATGTLAKLHILMRHEFDNSVSKAEPISEEYEKHNRELKKVRSYIRKSTTKGEFEFEFLKSFEEMFLWAEAAGNILKESGYNKLYRENLDENCMTHGEYNYHNILMNDSDSHNSLLAITSFEKFKQNIQVEDLYYFLRKVMEKYGWKERLGDSMLNAYSAVKPLTEPEVEYIKIRLVYPEKFWKIANSYYHSNKAWISVKNLEKLSVAVRQTIEKERFLKNVFAFTL